MTGPIDASVRYAQFGSAGEASPAAKSETAPGVGKEAFLRLLVAQIKNQNPLDPADGIEFITQLAQFSELEQMIEIRQGVEALRDALAAQPVSQTAAGDYPEAA